MGNDNLPQPSVVQQEGILETRLGAGHLTEAQQGDVRAPGPVTIVAPNPKVPLEQALGGYTGTGHSPADAT